jgi:hypothetical protein
MSRYACTGLFIFKTCGLPITQTFDAVALITMTGYTAEIIKAALSKYNSYNADWERKYFNQQCGGYNVYHKDHQFSQVAGGGNAETTVGKMLANQGKQVEFLPEGETKCPDIRFDDQTWDIKFIEKANEETIRKCIKNARKADNALFYWENDYKLIELHSAVNREISKYQKKMNYIKCPIFII